MATSDTTAARWRERVLRLTLRLPALSRMAESVNAFTVADKLDRARSGGDIVAVVVPPGRGAWRSRRVKLHRHHGSDQVAEAIARGGWKAFEPPLPDLIVEACREFPGDVVDCGANTGYYTFLALASNRRVVVHAFEPFPPAASAMRRNAALNPAGHRLVTVAKVVSDVSGEETLYVPPPTGSLIETSSSIDPDFKGAVAETLKVPSVTLDDYWRSIARPPVGVVKIDTEGTEHRVLRGCRSLVEACRPLLFVEVLIRGAVEEMQEFIESIGYRDFRLAPDRLVADTRVLYDDEAWNHAFVPREASERFVAMANRVGVGVTGLA